MCAARYCGEPVEREDVNGFRVYRIGFSKRNIILEPYPSNPYWKKGLKYLIDDFKPDIIMPREIMLARMCGLEGKKHGIPVVMDMAENYPALMQLLLKYNHDFVRRTIVHKLKLPAKAERNSVPLMDGIITVCDEQNERLAQSYNYDRRKMQVVHNTPDLSFFSSCIRLENQQLAQKDTITLCHHGFLSNDKNIDVLVDAFSIAAQAEPRLRLIIAGFGECFDQVKEKVDGSPVRSKIELTGKYNYKDLPSILARADIGVLPYRLNDFNNYTLHNKVFDFFAAAKPVILSETNPFKRLINETHSGITCDCTNSSSLANGIIRFVSQDYPEYCRKAISAARNKYNWNKDLDNLISFLEKFS